MKQNNLHTQQRKSNEKLSQTEQDLSTDQSVDNDDHTQQARYTTEVVHSFVTDCKYVFPQTWFYMCFLANEIYISHKIFFKVCL